MKLYFVLALLFLIPLVIAQSKLEVGFNSNNPRVDLITPSLTSIGNYSLVNVNNSLFWQGHTGTDGSWLTGIAGSSYNSTYATWLPNYTLSNKFWYNQTIAEKDPIFKANLTSGFSQDVNPLTNIIRSLGNALKRWKTGWFHDINYNGEIQANWGNITNVSYIKLNKLTGRCDLTVNGSICSNTTGTYIIG